MIDFPRVKWQIYDRFAQEFIPLPTTGLYYIVDNEFLIIRPSTFTDEQCPGLARICERLHTSLENRPVPSHTSSAGLGKRRERASCDLEDALPVSHLAGPSKRRRTSSNRTRSIDVIDITDSE